jgi:NitT/TauT family transport system substrate-binding protein
MGAVMMRSARYVSFAIAVAGSTIAQAQSQQKATLRLDWTALGYHAPFYLGASRGYYHDAGLDLTIMEGKGSPAVASLVGNGSDDFGFSDASTVAQLVSQGLPVKVVMGVFQRSTLALFFPANKGIAKPADLKGKRIVLCPTDGLIKYLPAYLKAVGLTMNDVTVNMVDCSIKYSYLAQGNADVAGSYGTAGKPLLQAVGIMEVGKFDYADQGVSLPSHGVIAATATIQNRPEMVGKFVAASAKSWQDARDHVDDAVTALIAANPLSKGKEPLVKNTLLDSLQYTSTPGTSGKPFGWQSPEEWQKATTLLVEYTDMKAPASTDQFFTNEFIAK